MHAQYYILHDVQLCICRDSGHSDLMRTYHYHFRTINTRNKVKEMGKSSVCMCVTRVRRAWHELYISCLRSSLGMLAASIHISTTCTNIRRNISSCVYKDTYIYVSNAHSIHFTFTDSPLISTMLFSSSIFFPFFHLFI